MMELGEGLNKLRRYTTSQQGARNSQTQWVAAFVQDASTLLEFLYNTQLEHAACKCAGQN